MRVRRVVATAASVAVALTTVACTGDDSSSPAGEKPDTSAVQTSAATLAEGLATGDFAEVAFADGGDPAAVGEEYATTVEGLGELTPTVDVAGVEEKEG